MKSTDLVHRGVVRDDQIDAFAALSRGEYGAADFADPEHLRWKFLLNPHGVAYAHTLARDGDVFGRIVVMPRRMVGSGTGGYLVDLLIREDERGIRHFVELMRDLESTGDADFLYLAPNDVSAPLYRDVLKYQELGALRVVASPIRLARLLRARGLSWLMPLGFVGSVLWRLCTALAKVVTAPRSRVLLRDEVPSPAEFDAWMGTVAPELGLAGDRGFAYHRWRFHDVPNRTYRVDYVYERSELRGYSVTRVFEYMGVKCLALGEIVVSSGLRWSERVQIRLRALDHARRSDAVVVLAAGFGDGKLGRDLRGFPLVPMPSRAVPLTMPVFCRPVTTSGPPVDAFQMTMADIDVF